MDTKGFQKIFDHLVAGNDVIGVLQTGYGKSLIFQLLPYLFPRTKTCNIIIVISPLNSIIDNQIKSLKCLGIDSDDNETQNVFNDRIMDGLAPTVFCHPEAALSEDGRKLRRSKLDQTNAVALVVDKVYCVHEWYVIVLFHI